MHLSIVKDSLSTNAAGILRSSFFTLQLVHSPRFPCLNALLLQLQTSLFQFNLLLIMQLATIRIFLYQIELFIHDYIVQIELLHNALMLLRRCLLAVAFFHRYDFQRHTFQYLAAIIKFQLSRLSRIFLLSVMLDLCIDLLDNFVLLDAHTLCTIRPYLSRPYSSSASCDVF